MEPQQQNNQPPQSPDSQSGQPQQVYWTRPHEPQQTVLTPELERRSTESRQKYPHLNLSRGECVLADVRRHPIGLVGIWGGAFVFIMAMFLIVGVLAQNQNSISGTGLSTGVLGVAAVLVGSIVIVFAAVAAWIYQQNHFILTNESVIQNMQYGLFSKREQTVSLGNIEDASFTKHGILQHMFDYGSLRLSTEGDETTYRFHFATNPKQNIATLNNAVEAYKMGRPVDSIDTHDENN